MRLVTKLGNRARVFPTARRNRTDLARWLLRRPQIGAAIGAHELALLAANRLSPRLQALAALRAAALVNCQFCLDVGSAMALKDGLSERQMREVHLPDSDAFDELERLVLRLVDAMTATPAVVTPGLRDELLDQLSEAEYMELTAIIAWENHRARLNKSLGIRPMGFSDGAACALPA